MTDISKRRQYSQIVPVIRFDTPPVLEYGMKITKDLLDASITGLILTDIHGNSNTTDVLLENMQLSQEDFKYYLDDEEVTGGELKDANESGYEFKAVLESKTLTLKDENDVSYSITTDEVEIVRTLIINKTSPQLRFPHRTYYFLYPAQAAQECPRYDRSKATVRLYNADGVRGKTTEGVRVSGAITCPDPCEKAVSEISALYPEDTNYKEEEIVLKVTVEVACNDKPLRAFNALVKSFSCTNSFNGDSGNLQLTLIEDPKAIDPDNPTERLPALAAFPKVGTACYFKFRDFYFSGIFQRWSYSESVSGGRVYDVVISSPAPLLDKAHAICRQFVGNPYYGNNPFGSWRGPQTKYGHVERQGTRYQNRDGFDYEFNNQYVTNVLNPLAHWENAFVDNALTGKYFGRANITEQGWEVLTLLDTIQMLTNTRYGRRTGSILGGLQDMPPSTNHFGGRLRYGDTEFGVDFGELRSALTNTPNAEEYRVDGVTVDFNSLLKQISELIEYDYYTEILPVYDDDLDDGDLPTGEDPAQLLENFYGEIGGDGGGPIGLVLDRSRSEFINEDTGEPYDIFDPQRRAIWEEQSGEKIVGVIKIRAINRTEQPEPDVIKDFIFDNLGENNVISYDLGGELTNNTVQRLAWGAQATRVVGPPIVSQGIMFPAFANSGLEPSFLNTSVSEILSNPLFHNFTLIPIDINKANGGVATYYATLLELRISLGGKVAWETFKQFQTDYDGNDRRKREPNGYHNRQAVCPWLGAVNMTGQVLQNYQRTGFIQIEDLIPTDGPQARKMQLEPIKRLGDQIFSSVKKVAEEFYMQKFVIPMPAEPSHMPALNNQIVFVNGDLKTAWEICDAGWMQVLPPFDVTFFDNTGKLKACGDWPLNSNYDYSELGSDYFVAGTTIASNKPSVAKDLYWESIAPTNPVNFGTPGAGNHLAYCDSGAKVLDFDDITTPDFGLTSLTALFYGIALPPETYIRSNKQQVHFPIHPDVAPPRSFFIPQQSSRYAYGPWYSFNSFKHGPSEVVVDSRLAPENYGSVAGLDQAGTILANVGLAQFAEQESGSMTIHEEPRYRLGERFLSVGPYITDMNVSISVEAGTVVKYSFNTWTPNFGKLAKFNLDRIARIRQNSIEAIRKLQGVKRPFEKRDFKPIDKDAFSKKNKKDNPNMVNGTLGGDAPGQLALNPRQQN